MSQLLEGVRVIEVSMWGFVPTTGVVLADWGAEVVKIEHPDNPDPARGLMTSSWVAGKNGVRFLFEIFNRGKRCVAINLSHPEGRMVLYRLLEGADVFVTSLRADARERLGISAREISKRFPHLVYASGSGLGTEGPDANQGGYDLSAYWSRAGTAFCVTPKDLPFPADMPPPDSATSPPGRSSQVESRRRCSGRSVPARGRSLTCPCSMPACGRSRASSPPPRRLTPTGSIRAMAASPAIRSWPCTAPRTTGSSSWS
jgi:hypothetical protein